MPPSTGKSRGRHLETFRGKSASKEVPTDNPPPRLVRIEMASRYDLCIKQVRINSEIFLSLSMPAFP
ncbi:hypothetical protein CENSYa_0138 [Cenarchaeum symbiosum A]|uniref:Uncharacterized protein n=1 Tax=Cenarchaeum symbiosum (strain A) TaxID=414004 RepID=A0RTW6_CENSY|nr:hypothetical protein CENSYa_0138 [Cenarchaeum symbiosum A]